MFEILTLDQTHKLKKEIPVVLYGGDYWNKVINFDALVEYGTIDAADVDLVHRADTVDEAFDLITGKLAARALAQPGGFL